MKEESCCKKKGSAVLKVFGVVALLAALVYAVYYFFFADDYEDLDEDFFRDDEVLFTEGPDTDVEKAVEEAPGEATA